MSESTDKKDVVCPNCQHRDTMHIKDGLYFCPRCLSHFEFPSTPAAAVESVTDFDRLADCVKERNNLRAELEELQAKYSSLLAFGQEVHGECKALRAELAEAKEFKAKVKETFRIRAERESEMLDEVLKDADGTWLAELCKKGLIITFNAGETREETIGCICARIADERDELKADLGRVTKERDEAQYLFQMQRSALPDDDIRSNLADAIKTIDQFRRDLARVTKGHREFLQHLQTLSGLEKIEALDTALNSQNLT